MRFPSIACINVSIYELLLGKECSNHFIPSQNFLTILILSSFIVSSIKLKGVRALQEETDQLELLTHEEIRDLERQEKKDHDMIVNQAVDPGYRQHHEFVPRIKSGSEVMQIHFLFPRCLLISSHLRNSSMNA